MSKSKKIISLLLSVIMIMSVFSIVPFTANAAEAEAAATAEIEGDYEYDILDDGTASITKYTGEGGDITIPSTLGGYTVTSIDGFAFEGCMGLTSVTIPDSVTSIDYSAFRNCTGLTSVTIGNSITSIGSYAFAWCTSLTSIKVAEGNTVYDSRDNCNAIIETESNVLICGCKNTIIPDSVTSIGGSAFALCTSLTSIDIPDSVTSIGDDAFAWCTGLTRVDIPDSVTSIGDDAFRGCTGLTSVTIPDSVTSIGECAFSDCSSLTDIDIPNSVTSIGSSAFSGCSSLTSIDIPNSVKSIGLSPFSGCTGLTSIKVSEDNIAYDSRDNCNALIETESNKLMCGCMNTVIPNSITSIDVFAFEDCIELTSIDIPDSVTSIGGCAFYGCTGLTSVTIGNSVTSIGGWAFYGCTGLTSIDIPDSVTSIGSYAFAWCTSLTSIKVAEGNTVYDSRDNCNAIIETESNTIVIGCKSTVIPNSVTSIGYYAFALCTSLTSIDIPDSVTSIGERAFYGCTGLTSIDIPDSVTSIGRAAFFNCTGLTNVTIPDSVTSIGERAFYRCTGLTNIDIPESVTSIGNRAFYGCSSLTSVTIPDSVTSIGDRAFGYYYDDTEEKDKKLDGFTIYGYDGSEAEKYATENEFTFVPLKSKTNEATGIILAVPEDTDLTVKDITADISSDLPDDCNVLTAYDISLTKDGEAVQPENIVPVKIPCANENAKVYRFETDGKMTDMNAKYKDGYMVFTTDHFSIYVLAEPKPEVVTVIGDVTGDGKTNVQDCTAILRYVRKLDTLSEDQLKLGDVTGDGKVNVQDVTRILRHVRKIETLY